MVSGGSLNYLYLKADNADVFTALDDLHNAETYARDVGLPDVAMEVRRFLDDVYACLRRIELRGRRISPLLWELERAASFDGCIADVRRAYRNLVPLAGAYLAAEFAAGLDE